MKRKVYPFNKRGIEGREDFLKRGVEAVHLCAKLYEGEAENDCIREVLIDFSADGWSTGFQEGQKP